jgi:hypothetical protein
MLSQTMLPRSCSPIAPEIRRALSQSYTALVFEIRPGVAVEGDDQSVNNTGSHTTTPPAGLSANPVIM